jgi:uncharacterized secreted protein with C-terminal beta-propeller domain
MSSKDHHSRGLGAPLALFLIALFVGSGIVIYAYSNNIEPKSVSFSKFESCNALSEAFSKYQETYGRNFYLAEAFSGGVMQGAAPTAAKGVDEADIVKTDGQYVYTLSSNRLVIAKAYPVDQAEILSETDLGKFYSQEIFIDGNTVLIFGSTYQEAEPATQEPIVGKVAAGMPARYPYYGGVSLTTAQLWDVSDKSDPKLVRSVDIEGSYVSSRKIGSQVYYVVNSYPRYTVLESGSTEEIVPLYRDRSGSAVGKETALAPACGCTDVKYFEPIDPQNFITIASISMADLNAEVSKEVIVGSGQNIYASLSNLYIAETNYPYYRIMAVGIREGGTSEESQEKTIVHKFSMNSGRVSYLGNMQAPGRILNQFSMDEYNNNFRIATTIGHVSRTTGEELSSNNVYIFNSDLSNVGQLEDIAPGEQIYSVRFMGDRGYMVTFKKIDPFFVIDLSDPQNPQILGKLKIPGYSDYLHPYDENHIIGIGKEAVDSEEPNSNFAWYQGMKIAIFDVTDVSNPIEMHKVEIGDRGTDSEALHDHKAFLFDREKNLLVIPVTLAEIKGDKTQLPSYTYGDYVYQGAYVYRVTLENGFELKGRVTHYDDYEVFMKSGYYFGGDYNIRRSLYIDNILYTISSYKIKLNSLDDLSQLKELNITVPEQTEYYGYGYV